MRTNARRAVSSFVLLGLSTGCGLEKSSWNAPQSIYGDSGSSGSGSSLGSTGNGSGGTLSSTSGSASSTSESSGSKTSTGLLSSGSGGGTGTGSAGSTGTTGSGSSGSTGSTGGNTTVYPNATIPPYNDNIGTVANLTTASVSSPTMIPSTNGAQGSSPYAASTSLHLTLDITKDYLVDPSSYLELLDNPALNFLNFTDFYNPAAGKLSPAAPINYTLFYQTYKYYSLQRYGPYTVPDPSIAPASASAGYGFCDDAYGAATQVHIISSTTAIPVQPSATTSSVDTTYPDLKIDLYDGSLTAHAYYFYYFCLGVVPPQSGTTTPKTYWEEQNGAAVYTINIPAGETEPIFPGGG